MKTMAMDAKKRQRLAAAGWQETNVQDLLGLSGADVEYIETKLALARRVRDLRREQGLTQTALASHLGTSQSRVAKMEAGDASVSLDLLLQTLFRMGLKRHDLAAVV